MSLLESSYLFTLLSSWGLAKYCENFASQGITESGQLAEILPHQYATYGIRSEADVDKLT